MIEPTHKKISREQLQPGEALCDYCVGKCCRYFALPFDAPTTHADFEYIRWYLLVHTKCKHLLDDNRCGIYDRRPQICREYSTDDCEFDDDFAYERYFETPEQIHEYAEAVLQTPGQEIRSPRPALLPVLS